MKHETVTSEELPPVEAHELIVELEHAGVPPRVITIDTTGERSTKQLVDADRRSIQRLVSRVSIGALVGLTAGLGIGLFTYLTTSESAAVSFVFPTIASTLLGSLYGLYSRLSLHRNISDLDMAEAARVSVDLHELDDHTAAVVDDQVRENPTLVS